MSNSKVDVSDCCGDCKKVVTKTDDAVQCEFCEFWFHIVCQKISKNDYSFLRKQRGKSQFHWFCDRCNNNSSNVMKLLNSITERQDKLENRVEHVEIAMATVDNTVSEIKNNFERISGNVLSEVEEKLDRERRRLNLLIRNIPENTANVSKFIEDMFEDEELHNVSITSVERLGRIRNARGNGTGDNAYVRPVKISCQDMKSKWEILALNKKLRVSNKGYQNIFIDPDLTAQQRSKDKELRQELKRRKENGEENLIIKKGEIIVRPARAH